MADEYEVSDLEYEDEEEEEAEDPLADLDEDTRAKIEAHYQARTAAEAEALAEEKSKALRGSLGRWGQAKKELDALGLTVDEGGHVAAADPQKLLGYVGQFGGQQQAAKETSQEEDLTISPYDDEATLTRKVDLRTKRAVEEATKPLLEAMQTLTGYLGQQALPQAATAATPFLEMIGLSHVATAPEFQQGMALALKDVPLSQRSDEATIRAAAGMVLGSLPAEVLKAPATNGQRTERPTLTDREFISMGQRANLAQAGASRGRASSDPNQIPEFLRGEWETLKAAGVQMSVAEFMAAADTPDEATGRSNYHSLLAKNGKR